MTIRLTTLFMTAALALPGAAWSKPSDRDFGQTFPAASRLCQAVADGHAPKRLQGSEADVTAACDTLQSAYDAAVAAAPNTDSVKQAIADAKEAVQSACTNTDDRSGCRAALQQARQSLRSMRASYRDSVKTYHEAIRTARRAFWTTIKGLVGSSSVDTTGDQPDSPVDFPGAPDTA